VPRGSGTQRALAVLGAVAAAVALPASGGAGPSDSLRAQAHVAAGREAGLAARSRGVLLEVYALDSSLARARARTEALSGRTGALQQELAAARRHVTIARGVAAAAERSLAERLRQLYVAGDTDPMEIILGARSLDEAVTGLDELRRATRFDERVVAEASAARHRLRRLERRLEARVRAVERLRREAARAALAVASQRAERSRYLADLGARRRLASERVASLEAAARTVEAKAAAVVPVLASSDPVSGHRTLTVVATGYSLRGATATGLGAGWGVVAVDPSVIPLGTRLSIPGYGEGVAADVGAGVAGALVDLWFPTQAQARAWGRRAVTITLH
jgi:3D (Asp-Asp-Asp) domain-containing protein